MALPISGAMIKHMPIDILIDILKRVSPKDLLRCLGVWKPWKSLIRSKYFYKVHLNWSLKTNAHRTLLAAGAVYDSRDTTDFYSCEFYDRDSFSSARNITQPLKRFRGETFIMGCLNGLVCIFNTDDDDLGIWNPCIQKFRLVPRTPYEIPNGHSATDMVNIGFGYFDEDYKIVRVFSHGQDGDITQGTEVKVYSLQTNSWKKIDSSSCRWSSNGGIFLQGALHWFGKLEPTSSGLRVLTLDFKTEMFKEILTPFGNKADRRLEVLNAKLCIGDFHDLNQVDFWVMEEYGVEHWTRLYTINKTVSRWTFNFCTPMALSKTGDRSLFLGYAERNLARCKLFWYDTENYTAKTVAIPGLPGDFDAAICVANLDLLDGVSVINKEEGYKQFEISEGEGSEKGEMSEGERSEEGEMSEGEGSKEDEMNEGEGSEEDEMSEGEGS